MRLTEHFTLEEFIYSETATRLGIDNTPSLEVIDQLTKLANVLERVRALFGQPILISSAYRSPKLNAAVGGSPNSQHTKGMAVDFRIPGFTVDEIVSKIKETSAPEISINFDQLIREFDSWVHLSISESPRKQVLIIDKKGTRLYA